jgi:histidinol phosphatase-like PHP family hydrolase
MNTKMAGWIHLRCAWWTAGILLAVLAVAINLVAPPHFAGAPATKMVWLDLHYHWEGKANLDGMIQTSQKLGIKLGVTGEGGDNWGLKDDATLQEFLKQIAGKPVYKGLQVYGLGWEKRYSTKVLTQLDYIAADALMFPDKNGRIVALWGGNVTFPDPQDFMERYVDFNVKVLNQPINIWSNPTYLPDSLKSRSQELWTKARMLKVIEAAAKNQVVIELNSKYNIPSREFILLAKQAGCRFSMGSNRHDDEPGNLDYAIRMYKGCGLAPKDMYKPSGVKVK